MFEQNRYGWCGLPVVSAINWARRNEETVCHAKLGRGNRWYVETVHIQGQALLTGTNAQLMLCAFAELELGPLPLSHTRVLRQKTRETQAYRTPY